MVSPDLLAFYNQVIQAKSPEDIFGTNLGVTEAEQLEALKKSYHIFCAACHPDHYVRTGDQEAILYATETFQELAKLRDEASKKISSGLYGKPNAPSQSNFLFEMKTRKHNYRVYRLQEKGLSVLMPWTSTIGASWEDRFRFVKEYCEFLIDQIETLVFNGIPAPEILYPNDWAKVKVLKSVLERIEELEVEARVQPSVESLNDLQTEPNDVLTRKTEFILRQWLETVKRVDKLEEKLKKIGAAFEQR